MMLFFKIQNSVTPQISHHIYHCFLHKSKDLSVVKFLLFYLDKNGNIINTITSTNFLLNYQFNKTILPKTEPFSIKVCACAA